MGQFWAVLVRVADRGSAPDEKSFHNVANRRDGCTIVLLLRSKRKFRLIGTCQIKGVKHMSASRKSRLLRPYDRRFIVCILRRSAAVRLHIRQQRQHNTTPIHLQDRSRDRWRCGQFHKPKRPKARARRRSYWQHLVLHMVAFELCLQL
jgi:hypothetical protein